MLDVEGLTVTMLLLVLVAAFAAGWLDAVVGGGGLLQLPMLLLVPGIAPVQALATNKLASVFGTATAAVTYHRKIGADLSYTVPIALIAGAGAVGGALLATVLPADAFTPLILVALTFVVVFTLLRPKSGVQVEKERTRRRTALVTLAGAIIGFYDGLVGPGTGTFLVLALVTIGGADFLRASAQAKVINFATNLGALLLFIPYGAVLWKLGLLMAAANIAGSYAGAHTALKKGAGFVRFVFLVVATALLIRLGYDVLTG